MEVENNNNKGEVINEISENENSNEFYIVKVILGKEEKFVFLFNEILKKKENHGISGVLTSFDVKGYIFVETESITKLKDCLRGLPNFRGIIKKPISFEDIEKYFTRQIIEIDVNEGDLVKVMSGPFKGDTAKVVRVISGKNQIIIESLNTQISIPLTIESSEIRVIEKKDEEDKENEE